MAIDLSFQSIGTHIKTKDGLESVADVDPRLTRSMYIDSCLVTAEELNRDQVYLDSRLREVGRALGYGVLCGLEIHLSDLDGIIRVAPGRGITRAGRVLELTHELSIDLGDHTTIAELNNGRYRRGERALYAIIVRYSEVSSDVAADFSQDLGATANHQYAAIREGVTFALVRLAQPLRQQNAIVARANLLQEWLGDNSAGGAIPEDAIALGVLAVSNDRLQWLDTELLRQPLRSYCQAGAMQEDLARRYQVIFKDLLLDRCFGSLTGEFAAADYFRLLPPVGSLPKDAINPVSGYQGYFPQHFNVWIAPVRTADIELLRTESMLLPAIDVSSDEVVDIVVLAPVANALYGQFAQCLQRSSTSRSEKLTESQDLLRLRLYPQHPAQASAGEQNIWREIWDKLEARELLYIRRPLRAAETCLSGIVLARGVPVPDSPAAVIPTPGDGGLLQNEDSVFLNRINLKQLAALRPPTSLEGEQALAELLATLGADAQATQQIIAVLLRIERGFDAIVWQTLLSLAKANSLAQLATQLQSASGTARLLSNIGDDLGLDAALVEAWSRWANA